MVKVENRETLRTLTKQFMGMNRERNRIAVFAIALTMLMITSLFCGSASLILSQRVAEIRQSMFSAHAIAQCMTEEGMERAIQAIEQNGNIKRYGTGVFLGAVEDVRLYFCAEMRQGDKNLAECYNSCPTTGKMPETEDEIAVSTQVLDALGTPHEIGVPITVTWEVNEKTGEKRTDEFRVCGFWESNGSVAVQCVWVSKAYAQAHVYPVSQAELQEELMNGEREIAVWYRFPWNLKQKTDKLSKEALIADTAEEFCENQAYLLFVEDGFPFESLAALLLVIMLSGYLITYNIFSLSVKNDIRVYGLLKNVGMTGKQLTKVVRMQAWRLSAAGIPIGLLFGIGTTKLLTPFLAADESIANTTVNTSEVIVSVNPILLLLAAVFTLITVYISSLQACRIVKRVSAVEAIKAAETGKECVIPFQKISAPWWGMAFHNVMRNFKKGLIAMLSVALSLIVMNCIVMRVEGYNFNEFLQVYTASDIQIDRITETISDSAFSGISPGVRKELNGCPYIEKVGYVYYSEEYHQMEAHLIEDTEAYQKKYQKYWTEYDQYQWKNMLASNQVEVHFLGINKEVFEKLEWRGEAGTWEEFRSGDKIVVDYGDPYSEEPFSYYEKGEQFFMEYQNGKEKAYTVQGEAMLPYALDYPYASLYYITVLVPETEFILMTGKEDAMRAAVDAKEGMMEEAYEYLKKNVVERWKFLQMSAVTELTDNFERYLQKFYVVGGLLVVVLVLIGIMTFFHTMAASIIGRKKELALLEAVGMTKRQLKKMLVLESVIYLAGSVLMAILFIVFASDKIFYYMPGQAFFFYMKITVWPCIAMLPLLLAVSFAVPEYHFKKMSRESIVERIRK